MFSVAIHFFTGLAPYSTGVEFRVLHRLSIKTENINLHYYLPCGEKDAAVFSEKLNQP